MHALVEKLQFSKWFKRDAQFGEPSSNVHRYEPRFDVYIIGSVIALLTIGTVMVYSASYIFASHRFDDPNFFLKRQLVRVFLAIAALWAGIHVHYQWYRKYAYPILFLSILCMVLLFVPGMGKGPPGFLRWLDLGIVRFQPAELAKFALIIYLAYSLEKKEQKIRTFSIGLLPHMVVAGLFMFLCMKQPDYGTAMLMLFVLTIMLFMAGAKMGYLILGGIFLSPIIYHAITSSPYHMKRIIGFMDPWKYQNDIGYQLSESLITIGSGGLTGLGLGEGRQKLFFLPEAHTDFIFSIIAEETGLIGVCILVSLFMIIFWRGLKIVWNTTDLFGRYFSFGIISLFGCQALINLSVTLGLVPTKGLTLPFVSYGGTSSILWAFAMGSLINVAVNTQSNQELRFSNLVDKTIKAVRRNKNT